jgi:hypothetical protein
MHRLFWLRDLARENPFKTKYFSLSLTLLYFVFVFLSTRSDPCASP